MVDSEINLLTYADDGGMLRNDKESIIVGIRMTCEVTEKWSLVVHAGCYEKNQRLNQYLLHRRT